MVCPQYVPYMKQWLRAAVIKQSSLSRAWQICFGSRSQQICQLSGIFVSTGHLYMVLDNSLSRFPNAAPSHCSFLGWHSFASCLCPPPPQLLVFLLFWTLMEATLIRFCICSPLLRPPTVLSPGFLFQHFKVESAFYCALSLHSPQQLRGMPASTILTSPSYHNQTPRCHGAQDLSSPELQHFKNNHF